MKNIEVRRNNIMYDGKIKAFNRAIGSLGAVLLPRKGSGGKLYDTDHHDVSASLTQKTTSWRTSTWGSNQVTFILSIVNKSHFMNIV